MDAVYVRFVRGLPCKRLVVAAAANYYEDEDYPDNPTTVILTAAIKEAAHAETSFRHFYKSIQRLMCYSILIIVIP